MLTAWGILSVALLYVFGLFAIAYYGDRQARAGRSLIDSPVIYSLSLAVYCTSWTFYGSVGRAVASGVGFLPIYLGPTLMALLWWWVLRKAVRIAKANRITSIADFLGSRYGQSAFLGGVVTVIMLIGITPYIALQLKAISQTFEVLLRYPDVSSALVPSASRPFYADTAFGTAVILTVFGIMFGARDLDSSRRHEGLVATIAFESLVKLLAFVAVGAFVTYGVFGGLVDIFARTASRPEYARLLGGDPAFSYGDWAALTWLSMMAILFLPRQFHMAVIGNTREGHIKTAMWMFPTYLLLMNLFVLPVALGGLLTFPGVPATAADYFVLTLPMSQQQQGLALFAFIGGISAATGMVIVESIALSTMILNTLVVPWLVRRGMARDISGLLINAKRLAIALTIFLGYAYYHSIGESYTLVNIGLISFAAVAQFAPAFFGGLYWRRATKAGALAGLGVGFAVWCYTVLVPSFVRSGWVPGSLIADGPAGIGWLRPEQLFGVEGLGFWAHTVFWSLVGNGTAFVAVSLYTRPSPLEAAQADRFVGVFAHEPGREPAPLGGHGLTPERLEELVAKFTGREKARAAFGEFIASRGVRDPRLLAEADRRELLRFAERTLSGAVGTASAQAIVEGVGEVATGRFEAIFDVFGKVSQSLEQSREDLERRVRELSLLNEATRRIAATLDPQRMMDGVVVLLTQEFEFDLLTVRLLEPDGRLRIKSHHGLPPGADLGAGDPVSRETYFGECFLDNRLIILEDPAHLRKPVVLPTRERLEPRSFVHAPIAIEERPIGVLSAYSSTGRVYFSPEFLQLFRTLAAQLGLGIHNARLYRELGDLSRELEAKVRQRTAELVDANRRLEELSRLKSDFVTIVSHELRTPLTSIRSLSESLLGARDMSRERQEQFLAIITAESQRMSRMISQLLDLSQIEAGKMEWRLEPLDLGEVVGHAVQANRSLFDARDITLVTPPPAGHPRVLADRDRVIQVVTNLLSNAAKFTPPGGTVHVRTWHEGSEAVVEVEDTGMGVPPEQTEAIFERFRRAGDTLAGRHEGVGLGLPISREIVQQLGGTLMVLATSGRGSRFRMTLPVSS
ncbi:MAG: ATP-binding protein [Candidatus Rokubacteria bacterium]|nr:ATP-binding protein [Candidatus Rokubacteria bacterium]